MNSPFFCNYEKLSEKTRELIDWDTKYSSTLVSKLDAAWQAWNKGVIETDPEKTLNTQTIQPTIEDNYRFVRRYFHPLWSWYIWLFRLVTLHNPFRETISFLQSIHQKRINLFDKIVDHEKSWNSFDSTLLKSNPEVSVIIPTLNRYEYLKDALQDLEQQDYLNFEVIIVDQSEPFRADFYDSFHLRMKILRQEEKALWLARNTAIKASRAEWIAMYEDDVRIPKNWLSNHLKCVDFFQADISAGVFFPQGSKIPCTRNFFRWADQFATGNALVKKDVFRKVGLFDRQFERQRMGDGEFGLRSYLAGFKSVSNPYAWCEDVKAPSGGLRQVGSWDAFRPKNWFAPRPVPSVLYYFRKYFGKSAAIISILTGVPTSLLPYKYKRITSLMLLSGVLGIILSPILLLQIFVSWHFASQKLNQGNMIENFNK